MTVSTLICVYFFFSIMKARVEEKPRVETENPKVTFFMGLEVSLIESIIVSLEHVKTLTLYCNFLVGNFGPNNVVP